MNIYNSNNNNDNNNKCNILKYNVIVSFSRKSVRALDDTD